MWPLESFLALMYDQTFLFTSTRDIFLPPQMALRSALRVFGAKIPIPFFFMIKACFLPFAFFAVVVFRTVVFAVVTFFVVVFTTALVVLTVIGAERSEANSLSQN